jgi:hypothetical protein
MNMMLSTSALTANAAEFTDAADDILKLIADHKAAIAATDVAMEHYGELEEVLPKEKRQGDMVGREVTEVAGDDRRWTAACHWFCDAFNKSDDIALQMLAAPITSVSSLAALMAYAGEHVEQGFLWPEEIVIDEIDDKARDWEQWVLMRAAKAMRDGLNEEEASGPPVVRFTPEGVRASAAEEKALASAFQDLESEVCDLPRAARLAQLQVHEAVGELKCSGRQYTEVPDYEAVELAVFAVDQVMDAAKKIEQLYYRLHNEGVSAGTKARTV